MRREIPYGPRPQHPGDFTNGRALVSVGQYDFHDGTVEARIAEGQVFGPRQQHPDAAVEPAALLQRLHVDADRRTAARGEGAKLFTLPEAHVEDTRAGREA